MSAKVKVLIVGDGAIGKTCLLSRITNNVVNFDDHQEYEPTTFNNFNLTWDSTDDEGNPRVIDLEIWDTAGQEGFEQLRTLSYPNTDIFLVGYSCTSTISLNNIHHKWMEEILKCREENQENDEPWIVMVGTKMDLPKTVTEAAADEVGKTINACVKVDTSAKIENIDESGVSTLMDVIKQLGLMKFDQMPRPNWGEMTDDPEDAIPSPPAGGDTKPKPAPPKAPPAAAAQADTDNGCCSIA